jgi:3'-5' exonuclease
MLSGIDLDKILFLDIETVPAVYRFEDLDDRSRSLWEAKTRFFQRDGETAESIYGKAGIYAEFGRIVCISVGVVTESSEGRGLRVKSFCNDDEKELLEELGEMLDRHFNTERHFLCAHNGKEFDFPYIARRMLINGVRLPRILDTAGKKPWQVTHLDTLELWKFGDRKHFTSLDLLVHIFGIPSPKTDISGSDVGRVYWEEKDLPRIVKYCEQDVLALAQLVLRYRGEELIPVENVVVA